MSERSHIDRVWDIIESVDVCMLTTRFEGGLRARPLEVRPDRSSNRLLFVTDAQSHKREEWRDGLRSVLSSSMLRNGPTSR